MAALIELYLALTVLAGSASYGTYRFYQKFIKSDWFLRRIQEKNRKRLEIDALFRCKEHKKTFRKEELVRHGSGVYCPDCYQEHILKEKLENGVITDLGDIHKEIFNHKS